MPEEALDADRHDDDDVPLSGLFLRLNRLLRKTLHIATWSVASLFGGLVTTATRQTGKRRLLDEICATNGMVALQETRGTQADTSTFPPTHSYIGTCVTPTAVATSNAIGTMLALRRI